MKTVVKIGTLSYIMSILFLFFVLLYALIAYNTLQSEKNQIQLENIELQTKYTNLQNTTTKITLDVDNNIKLSIISLNPKLDPVLVNQIKRSVIKYSDKYNLPPLFVISVMYRESSFRPTVVSRANCIGLMQINPSAHPNKIKELGISTNEIFYIDNNIRLGCWILREYIDKYNNVEKALKQYVGGNLSKYVSDITAIYVDLMIQKNTGK